MSLDQATSSCLLRRVVVRACFGVALSLSAVAAFSWGLAAYGEFEEPRVPRAARPAHAAVFPASMAALEDTTRKILAEQGAALPDIEPAAGHTP